MEQKNWKQLDTQELRRTAEEKLRALKIQSSYTASKSGLALFVMHQSEDLQQINAELRYRLEQNGRWIIEEAKRILAVTPTVSEDTVLSADSISDINSNMHEIIWDVEAILGIDSEEQIWSLRDIQAANRIISGEAG